MIPHCVFILLGLLNDVLAAGKIYTWSLPTTHFGMVTTRMTTLDKSLANDVQAYIKCYQQTYNKMPLDEEYKYNKQAYGRKKRDLSRSMVRYGQEIPFLIAANYSLCTQRRLAMAIRKFEERTCIKFVPYEGAGKHKSSILMIHNVQNDESKECISNYGQIGIRNSFLDGKWEPAVGSSSIKKGCERAFEHEMLHVLGFIHPQDSPYRQGSQSFWNKLRNGKFAKAYRSKANTEQLVPWERNSGASYIHTIPNKANYLSDWDVYKINKVYKCSRTAYGNKPINMNQMPPPVVNDFATMN